MSKKQVYNPYLPSFEYIPDGEPHVFGDRIYLYGSHDRFRGAGFCLNDYVCYSADIRNLTDWKYEGVIFRKDQDPRNQNIPEDAPEQLLKFGIEPEFPEDLNPRGVHAMWAPDVAQGPDGRYYLYYCLDFLPEIGVAVCDSPAGKYEFLGFVRHKDGTILGDREGDLIQFDPGVYVEEDGTVYLYSGNAPMRLENANGRQGSQVMELEPDMVTLKEEPRKLLPDITESAGTGYENHEFFEASSIRKINGRYYFVYSSVRSHELCYAVSDRPDGDYAFGGTLVDIGDIFLDGRTEENALNCLGNTHGGIEKAGDQWYVFYHRQTNRTNFSRQGCAEKIFFDSEGRIRQAEVTSCGLNAGPLMGIGTYPAGICCQLTAANGARMSHPLVMKMDYPYLTQDGGDMEPTEETIQRDEEVPVQYIRNMQDGSTAGYKYFALRNLREIRMDVRGDAEGIVEVRACPKGTASVAEVGAVSPAAANAASPGETGIASSAAANAADRTETGPDICPSGPVIARIAISSSGNTWKEFTGDAEAPNGTAALYFTFRGRGRLDFRRFTLAD